MLIKRSISIVLLGSMFLLVDFDGGHWRSYGVLRVVSVGWMA
jgi:hypothetical protein